MWHVLNRFIAKTTRRNEYMAAQKTAQDAGALSCVSPQRLSDMDFVGPFVDIFIEDMGVQTLT